MTWKTGSARTVLLLALGTAISIVVLVAALLAPATAAPPAASVQLGYRAGDDWEPSIAADRFGHVYVLWTHYTPPDGLLDPACTWCASPHQELQISSDGGKTWGAPFVPFPALVRQDDPQIVVDPIDGRTVYASYMQGNKSSQYVAKSADFGQTWTTTLVEDLQRGTDKDILAVRGEDVYLAYNAVQKIYASVSHDGGATWTLDRVVSNTNSKLGWSLPGGGAVDSRGNVYFAWDGYTQNGKPSGPVYLYVSKSVDGGATWTVHRIATSEAPAQCSCGWAYWGAQPSLATDANDTVYVLYNASSVKYGPSRMYLATSTDGASTWSTQDISLAPAGANNVFPAVAARGAGVVRIAWMDDRNGRDDGSADGTARWNVYYRTSTDGGATWSPEIVLNSYADGFGYLFPDGFNEPYGDYMELDIDGAGRTHATWGGGPSYAGPGNVWYRKV